MAEPVKKAEPYVHQDFPLRLYHATKGELVVHTDAEHAAALKKGFMTKPKLDEAAEHEAEKAADAPPVKK